MSYEVKIREDWCKGCYLCQNLCPKDVFDKADEINEKGIVIVKAARENDCIGCMQCANHCPDLAISIIEEEEKDAS
ncbi:MAG: 4Fe-4S dicluster domain-containing protein [Candidatus Mcinerneyibacterium aminivorans]|uniref:4Fe-4S dicluster domain-containing protein n=1 Tax=Candidatus Mcinerneyibacterium aminivorans TaxID=2703815 RepID=A0A5D0MFA7_9BACT|nr:MAG: 4Fe-4S dicluster domain-containing protein [Candidatus Mcinerneyibacterium aminivorans]